METEKDTLSRTKSPRRIRHQAKVKVFVEENGSLENIRKRLQLRPSQICDLLRVHPSAWTRWTKDGEAPPHIYQMLEWYLELLKWRGQNVPLKEPEERVVQKVELAPVANPSVSKNWILKLWVILLFFQLISWGFIAFLYYSQ